MTQEMSLGDQLKSRLNKTYPIPNPRSAEAYLKTASYMKEAAEGGYGSIEILLILDFDLKGQPQPATFFYSAKRVIELLEGQGLKVIEKEVEETFTPYPMTTGRCLVTWDDRYPIALPQTIRL